jgi:hypothetical protein
MQEPVIYLLFAINLDILNTSHLGKEEMDWLLVPFE